MLFPCDLNLCHRRVDFVLLVSMAALLLLLHLDDCCSIYEMQVYKMLQVVTEHIIN